MPDPRGNIDWAKLVPIRGRARYQAGTIFAPGKVFEECGIRIVLEGTVRFSILAADGKEQVLAYLPKGSIFGEQAALGRVPLHADNFVAIVDEPSEIGTLWASDLIAAFQRRSDVFADLMRISAEKTSLIVQAATRSAFGSARARIINVLSMLRQGNDIHLRLKANGHRWQRRSVHPKHFLQNVLRNPLGMLGVELVPHWLAIHSILHRRDELAVQTCDKCHV